MRSTASLCVSGGSAVLKRGYAYVVTEDVVGDVGLVDAAVLVGLEM